jgi:CheY-like chemotaxis protein
MLTVALYGNSLVLASIGARLERRTGLQPVTIDAALPGALERLNSLQPDVVLVDLGTTQPDPVLTLWKARPELVLIGVDLAADRMLVLSGQAAHALTAEDLIETLSTYAKGHSPCTKS